MNHPIEMFGVHRHFGGVSVLEGFDLRVAAGEAYALLGRNGTGKTTAIRILLGFLEPHAGDVRLLGRPASELRPADRERIGYVSEGHRVYGEYRVGELVKFEAATRSRFDRDFVERAIDRLELSRTIRVSKYSRGMRAQLSLLFAVAGRPELLVFDDPALGLDAVMRREFLNTIIELLAGRGCTVLYSSHILTDVERVSDRIGILSGGRLIVDATLDDLRARIQKRFLRTNGRSSPAVPALPGLLRAERRPEGFELTLLDSDAERLALLGDDKTRLSEARVPNLEELFFDLTAGDGGGVLSPEEVWQ